MKTKHKNGARTAKDEALYDESLRQEADIVREVIVEQRGWIEKLLENQERTLRALIEMGDSLRGYRAATLDWTRVHLSEIKNRETHCVPGCQRHAWDVENGWQRTERK